MNSFLPLSSFFCCVAAVHAVASPSPSPSLSPDGESAYRDFQTDGALFRVAAQPWAVDGLGNHRALVRVKRPSASTIAVLPWRRADLRAEEKQVIVLDPDGRPVENVSVSGIHAEFSYVCFDSREGAGVYQIYYLPHKYRRKWGDARYGKPWNDYFPAIYTPDPTWLEYIRVRKNVSTELIAFESRTRFDFFTPMGLIATQVETQRLRKKYKQNPVVIPEDRAYPIRLRKHLPAKWGLAGEIPSQFSGQASRYEYYTWQLGIWAAHGAIEGLKLEFSDLRCGEAVIPAKELTCFNQEGVNWDGTPFEKTISVPDDQVQALWCGVQIPRNAATGTYTGTVTVTAAGVAPQTIPIHIKVDEKILADRGDGDLWRHSRLRWLNSQIGVDDKPVAPYAAMQLDGRRITLAGKQLELGEDGLINNVSADGKKLFTTPLQFSVQTQQGAPQWSAPELQIKQDDTGLVTWSSLQQSEGLTLRCEARAEYDGYVNYKLTLSSKQDISVTDTTLSASYTPASSPYFMGLGYSGGATPAQHTWSWDGPSDSYWIGGALLGAHVEFRGGSYHGPLLADYKPAPAPQWFNAGKGRVSLVQDATLTRVSASTGSYSLAAGQSITYEFSYLLTPVKKLDTKHHFSQRYFHSHSEKFDAAAKEGANIANIHHSRSLNPVINYPFIVQEPLKKFIKQQHAQDRKVKLYYTIRELSNYCAEIHALMSLNGEIFADGRGYGTPWHMEHLIEGYRPAWYTELPNDEADAALVLSGFSRWINYYLEGLRWMFENYEIDGIYMDDVSFDRNVMKRMRKIMAQYRPEALIDLHSNTNYSKGAMHQYTDFFPYVDRLWFGEHFKYEQMNADEWFVTFSGIPMGLMSEMLQGGGNRYLGMVYGATGRHSYSQFNPAPIWALWESFGIGDAQMVGYWSDAPAAISSHPDIKATAFIKKGEKTLIALGNFSHDAHETTLTLDWKALGLDPAKVRVHMPAIEDFQEAQTVDLKQPLKIKGQEGVILLVE